VARPRLRTAFRAIAAIGGTAVVAAVAAGVVPLGPSLSIRTVETPMAGGRSVHEVFVEVRGGETVDRVTVEAASEGVVVLDPRSFAPVPPERGLRFRVFTEPGTKPPHVLRVVQEARVGRTYDVALTGDGR
jgi:hypothetical protein